MINESSKKKLSTCHKNLQKIFNKLAETENFIVTCGIRNKTDQEKAFNEGKSSVHYPNSKHNFNPSNAVDICPSAVNGVINWNDTKWFKDMNRKVQKIADQLGISIKYGIKLGNGNIDYPHYELKV